MESDDRQLKSEVPGTRQTLSYLRNLFAERGIKPKSKLRQNFLIDLNLGVRRARREAQERAGTKRIKLVANLPYAVAVPVISNLLLTDLPVERMVVTVQGEIGERLIASPGTKDYGALAVLVQSLAD